MAACERIEHLEGAAKSREAHRLLAIVYRAVQGTATYDERLREEEIFKL